MCTMDCSCIKIFSRTLWSPCSVCAICLLPRYRLLGYSCLYFHMVSCILLSWKQAYPEVIHNFVCVFSTMSATSMGLCTITCHGRRNIPLFSINWKKKWFLHKLLDMGKKHKFYFSFTLLDSFTTVIAFVIVWLGSDQFLHRLSFQA